MTGLRADRVGASRSKSGRRQPREVYKLRARPVRKSPYMTRRKIDMGYVRGGVADGVNTRARRGWEVAWITGLTTRCDIP